MASNNVLSAILHYKRNIDKISDPPERALKYEDRLLHCINRLYKLPVNVNHLQETGIGKTVNALRKIEGEKGLGDAAKALVAKWKTMVMLEDEAERKQREEPPPAPGPAEEDLKKIKLIREAQKSQSKKTDDSLKSTEKHHYDNHKGKSYEENKESTNKKHKSESVDIGRDKKRKLDNDDHRHHSKHSKKQVSNSEESDNIEETGPHEKYSPAYASSKSSSSSPSKLNSSGKNSEKISHKGSGSSNSHEHSKHEKKKEHKSSSSHSSSSSSSKHGGSSNSSSSRHNHDRNEYKKSKVVVDDDGGIDSQSGASFADALGPMVVKKSKKKVSTQSGATSSSSKSESASESSSSKEKKQLSTTTTTTTNKQIDITRPPANLEPLEPDLIATLPVPTPYYKPSPIYHLPPQEASRKRIQAEEDALNTIMSNKNQRTKVYSGVKGGLTYVPTLYEFCCRVLQQHLDAIEYTGGIPYSLLKPVLDGATPAQLFQFEHYNPYIIEDTDHLWKFHCNKEFRNESRQEFESWRDMYLRCIDEREERYKAVTANIQKSIEKSAPVRKAKLAYIDVANPPRSILRKQIKNGTAKPEASRLLGKNDPDAVRVAPPKQPTVKEPPAIKLKPKAAPLMQKILKSIKTTRFKR